MVHKFADETAVEQSADIVKKKRLVLMIEIGYRAVTEQLLLVEANRISVHDSFSPCSLYNISLRRVEVAEQSRDDGREATSPSPRELK